MFWFALSSVSSARFGIQALFFWITLYLLWFIALRLLDDPGEDWPSLVWIAPFVGHLGWTLAFADGFKGWGSLVLAFVLGSTFAWVVFGPWMEHRTWRQPVLAMTLPVFCWGALVVGKFANHWLPILLLK